jgi:hypothetical protein
MAVPFDEATARTSQSWADQGENMVKPIMNLDEVTFDVEENGLYVEPRSDQ